MSFLKIPSYRGQPVIVDGMKAKFIGEFMVSKEIIDPYTDEPVIEPYQIPWTTIKEIYKKMALFASEHAIEPSVQVDANGCGLCDFERKTTSGKFCSACGNQIRTT